MKRITIGGKEYTFEFSIEATLYDECTVKAMEIFINAGAAQAEAEEKNVKNALQNVVSTVAGVPQRALTFFYAGLLEHHGTNGDRSIKSINDAKRLAAIYMAEHPEDNDGRGKSWFDISNEMAELMAEDSFFDKIGLNDMMGKMEQTETPKRGRKKKENTNFTEV